MYKIPKLKESIEISLFDISSSEKHYILTCEDKRWQITELLYNICKAIDGERDVSDIASIISENVEPLSVEDTETIINDFFIKRGLLENTVDTVGTKENLRNKYLWGKFTLIKSSVIEKTKFLSALFDKRVMLALFCVGLLIQLFAYIKYINLEDFFALIKFDSLEIFIAFGLLYIAIFFHEFGHMAAFMKHDIIPGDIGFGFYFTAPALYSDVSAAWKLSRKQRVLVDIGGMYFEFLFYSIMCLAGLLTMRKVYVFAGFIGQIGIYRNLNPFLKFDGYWIVSDSLGIPNLHQKVKDFFIWVVNYIFGIKTEPVLYNTNKREKVLFYIFAGFNVIYIASYIIGLGYLFVVVSRKVKDMLVNLLTKQIEVNSFSQLLSFIKANVGTLILFLILIKIGSIAIKGVIKARRTIVEGIREIMYSKKEKTFYANGQD